MLEKGSNKRTFPVDRHAGMVRIHCRMTYVQGCPQVFRLSPERQITTIDFLQAVAGVIADGRQVVNRAFDEAVQYKRCVNHCVQCDGVNEEQCILDLRE
jgi:hypothetical protein